MKLRLPRRRLWRAVIYLISLVLIAIAIDLVLVQVRRTIHPGYETTRITSPTLPDGSIDYLTAVENSFSRDVTPDNNAAIPILQALGRRALAANQPPDGITSRLGMAHLPEKGDYFIPYKVYSDAHAVEDDVDVTEDAVTWPVTIKPATAQWIEANTKPLALLTEAAKRTHYFLPFNGGNRPTTLISVLIPQATLLRDTRRALLTRAVVRLDAGDVDGFEQDIHTTHKLARLLMQDPTIVQRLIAIALDRGACRAERLGISSGKLSPQQLHDMQNDLSAMGEMAYMNDCIDTGERYMALDLLQAMAVSNATGRAEVFNAIIGNGSTPPLAFYFWPISYDQCMRRLNEAYDSAIVVMQKPTYAQRVEAWNAFNQSMILAVRDAPLSRFMSPDWPVQTLMAALLQCNAHVDEARMDDTLTEVALALAMFKNEHASYPVALSELVPKYLGAVPQDVFSDKSIIYSRTEKGYKLYSIGQNMKDDGGKTGKPADDIVASQPQ